ncbi:hypothetical protein CPC08DRAFT_789755 [Agrocybe pediades]|nr:hypothetical protein CPC08DRAFT_789755 [Agrocybe pediades]
MHAHVCIYVAMTGKQISKATIDEVDLLLLKGEHKSLVIVFVRRLVECTPGATMGAAACTQTQAGYHPNISPQDNTPALLLPWVERARIIPFTKSALNCKSRINTNLQDPVPYNSHPKAQAQVSPNYAKVATPNTKRSCGTFKLSMLAVWEMSSSIREYSVKRVLRRLRAHTTSHHPLTEDTGQTDKNALFEQTSNVRGRGVEFGLREWIFGTIPLTLIRRKAYAVVGKQEKRKLSLSSLHRAKTSASSCLKLLLTIPRRFIGLDWYRKCTHFRGQYFTGEVTNCSERKTCRTWTI